MRLLPLLLLLTACGGGNEDEGPSDRDRYIEEICRLYVEDACLQNMSETCGFSLEFDTMSDCTFLFRLGMCTEATDALQGDSDTLACIDALDSFDCATQDICNAEGEFDAGGAVCQSVEDQIDAACPEDSGM